MSSRYCYGPKVQEELLIHGHRGSEVDADSSSDNFHLQQELIFVFDLFIDPCCSHDDAGVFHIRG